MPIASSFRFALNSSSSMGTAAKVRFFFDSPIKCGDFFHTTIFLFCFIPPFIVTLPPRIKKQGIMTTFALNNLWTYLQGLTLSQREREWLANKLIMPKETMPELTDDETSQR